jgi:voltage-gated potassium channel Kch
MFDEIISHGTLPDIDKKHLRRLILFFVISIISGVFGTYRYLSIDPAYSHLSTEAKLFEAIVTTIAFFGLNTGPFPATVSTWFPTVIISRIFAAILVSYLILLGLWMIFATQLRPYKIVVRNYISRFLSKNNKDGHIIICGLGSYGAEIALSLINQNKTVVVLEKSFDASTVSRIRSAGGTVFEQDATQKSSLLNKAKINLASEIYVTCGSNSTNAEVVQAISNCVAEDDKRESNEPIRCFANISTREYRHNLHQQVGAVDGLWLHSYDVPTATARELLQSFPIERLDQNPDAERISVVIIGWTKRMQAILSELCYTMHYGNELDRSINVICESPNQAKSDFFSQYPGIIPENWSDNQIQEFVQDLFPEISFYKMASPDERIITGSESISNIFESGDVLTLLVDPNENQHASQVVSLMKPHLERYESDLSMDTHVAYYDRPDFVASQNSNDVTAVESDILTIVPFIDFWDGMNPENIQGRFRDSRARQIALFYHILYEYDDQKPNTELDKQIETYTTDSIDSVDDASSFLTGIDDYTRQKLEMQCWDELSEEYRDSNRHAADHIRIKNSLAQRLSGSWGQDEVVDYLAHIEHHRWCAEKFLRRWKPLPLDQWDQWDNETTQQELRDRRIHRDLWPISKINKYDPKAFDKDVSQVQFLLTHINNN